MQTDRQIPTDRDRQTDTDGQTDADRQRQTDRYRQTDRQGHSIYQHYASTVYAVVLSVCPSVCPARVRVLPKWLNVGSRKQHGTIVLGV